MTRKLLLIALASACLVAFASPAGGGRVRIRAAGSTGAWEWQPGFRHIVKGTVVIWKNPTDTDHKVTAYTNNWTKDSSVASGEATRKRFRNPGLYGFRCTVPGHSSMNGSECNGMCGEVHVTRN